MKRNVNMMLDTTDQMQENLCVMTRCCAEVAMFCTDSTIKHSSVLNYTVALCSMRDSSVRIVIRYGLDGSGIESRWK
jgi:hypothetical protein